MKKLLYYFEPFYDSWVFTTEEEVKKQEDRYAAFSSNTWGEFRETLPTEDYEWVGPILALHHFEREEYSEEELAKLEEPADDTPFKQQMWRVWNEYPEFLIFFQEGHIPKAILEKYAEIDVTMHNGEYYHFEEEVINDVLRELKEHGIECEHRDDLEISLWE